MWTSGALEQRRIFSEIGVGKRAGPGVRELTIRRIVMPLALAIAAVVSAHALRREYRGKIGSTISLTDQARLER
jgi:hypothetical protein